MSAWGVQALRPLRSLTVAVLFWASIAQAQYSQRVWQSTDGLPEDFAQALAQTQDGYLWIGTSGGLVRFDGNRFRVFHRENEPAFRDDSVYSMLTARDGTLWIGTEGGGLLRYRAGKFRAFGAREGLTNGFVRVIFEDKDLGLWIGTDRGLFRMERETLVHVNQMAIHSICQDRAGRLLIGGSGLLVLGGAAPVEYRSSESQADNSIRTIRETRDGALWIGTISGLRRLERGLNGDPFPARRMIDGMNISALREGREGSLWIGTYGQGLMRYVNGRVEKLAIPHNNVLALFEDSEDDVWVGTQGGLLRLSRSAATTVTSANSTPQTINTIYQDPQGVLYVAALNGKLFQVSGQSLVPASLPAALTSLPIRNVFRDRSGALWLGTDGQGVVRGTTRYTSKDGLVNDFVRAFCEDRDGSVWIGTDAGLSRWRAGTFQNFNTKDGLAYGSIRALLLAGSGDVWVATDGGLSRFRHGGFVADRLAERLRGEKIWALHEDSHAGLWVGTHGAGLWLLANGTAAQFTVKDGLLSNTIHHIVEDARGNLWLSGPGGIVAVSRREMEERAGQHEGQPAGQLAVRVYGTSEGLTTNQMNGGVQPAGAMTPAGEVWFASAKGAVRIDPEVQDRGNRPLVVIEEVLADDRAVEFAKGLRDGPGEGKLEIHYTAIRLRSPERTQFKYWMEGFERDWTDAGQRRIAYYTNLTAGTYRFHVVAYERHDPRNAAEQILHVVWRPHFYQTEWFLALCGLAAISAAWGGYRLHVRNLRARFAAVLEERNRLAREMHDTLIQGCVGVSTLLEAASHAQDVSPGVGRDLLDRARNEVRAAVDEARMAVWNLRHGSSNTGSLNEDDLAAEVSDLANRIGAETGVPVRFERSGTPVRIGAEGERSLLMLIREALHNAVRHAQPTHLAVILRFERGGLQVEVHDDGCGFDPALSGANGHYGLIGMRERVEKLGGEFRIASEIGVGTKVMLRIPEE